MRQGACQGGQGVMRRPYRLPIPMRLPSMHAELDGVGGHGRHVHLDGRMLDAYRVHPSRCGGQ